MQEILDQMINQVYTTTWLEAIAVFFGLASVWFSKEENILVYPTGIISVVIYVYITFQYRLYADMGINGYYFVMSVYGWYHWKDTKREDRDQIPVTTLSLKEFLISLVFLAGSVLLIWFVLSRFTDSDVPLWDALTTSCALVGMWLMARKKIENWIAWIITDFLSMPLYLYKGLPFTSFQFFVFTVLSFWGYWSWKKSLNNA